MKKSNVVIIVLCAILLVIGSIGLYFYNIYKDFNEEYQSTETVEGDDVSIEIPMGSSTKSIAAILKENGLINYEYAFVKRVKESEYNGQLKYGTFTLNTGMNIGEMIEILAVGDYKPTLTFTIPEGYSIEMMATKLENDGICSASDFLQAVENDTYDYAFISQIPNNADVKYKLQGYLFPSTYEIYEDSTAHDVVDTMLGQFNKIYADEYADVAASLGYSQYEIVTMASIIEREAKLDEERPTISGVIYNRLNIDMMLQMCPTVLYPLTDGKYNVDQVLYDDLEIDSPYNTYKYAGLPVGPICNPGEASIKAALYPETHNYLYYHTDDPELGNHIFTETYEEHLETIQ